MNDGGMTIAILVDRIELLEKIEQLERELQEMTAYADKLADGLPMLPKDIEIIQQANWSLAEENNKLKRERDELRDMLGMMDVAKIAENIDRMREWLK